MADGRAWWATVGGALGAALAVRGGRWDALVAGWAGEPGALGAAVELLYAVTLATVAGVFVGLIFARALGRRGGGLLFGAAAVLFGAGLALAALPGFTEGDPGRALVDALIVLFVGPAVALVPWALARRG